MADAEGANGQPQQQHHSSSNDSSNGAANSISAGAGLSDALAAVTLGGGGASTAAAALAAAAPPPPPPAFAPRPRRGSSAARRSSAAAGGADGPACPALVVFSGGTAFNSLAGHLRQLTTRVAHVLPVSDDGGSTAEIVRVLGGPAVGDIRSRCLRLADDDGSEARAVKALLAHRLPAHDAGAAKAEWYAVVEGQHALWDGVSEPYKHMIRAFLIHFHVQILSHSTEQFNFANGSVGNFFFAGARTFFRSLESAIFLFSRVARIPEGSVVLPAICTEERITLGAELEDGTVVRGQNEISHPSGPRGSDAGGRSSSLGGALGGGLGGFGGGFGGGGGAQYLRATSGGGDLADGAAAEQQRQRAAASSPPPSVVDKSAEFPPLPSPIRRVFYLSREGTGQEHEVYPPPNPRILSEIAAADAIVYGIGSLYTSVCPSLILEGVGEAIAARAGDDAAVKVMLLNGSHDRETAAAGAHGGRMRASDVVAAVADALNRRRARRGQPLRHAAAAYVNAVMVPRGSSVEVDREALELMGVRDVIEVDSAVDAEGRCVYDPEALVLAIGRLLVARGVITVAGGGGAAGVVE